MKEQLCMIVENQPNVLVRVFRLLARHGLSVDSLTVVATPDHGYLEIKLTPEQGTISRLLVAMLVKLIEVVEVRLA